MASYQLITAALVVVLVQQSCCQIAGPTQITITPRPLTMTPTESDNTGGQVTITCRASSIGAGEGMISMNILRVLHSSPNAAPVVVVGASSREPNAELKLTSLQGRANVSGSLSTKSITLTLTRATCADGGMYTCRAQSLDDTVVKRYEASQNVTIQVSPGNITLTADPSGITNWAVNQTLIIRCNGILGTVEDPTNPNVEWVWEYQNVNPDFPPTIPNWQSYSLIGDPDDINNEPLLPQTGNQCYRRQISVLTRHLGLDDTNRQYRCYVNNRDVSGQIPSQDYAQVLEVGTVTESGIAPVTPGSSTGNAQKADVGAIVGGVIGALIVIVVIIVLVYFLVIRKRRNRDSPDPSKPADEQPPPGYTPDPHVTYSQPKNRFKKDDKSRGQTNQGMDNSDEKPPKSYDSKPYDTKPAYESKPARYENDFSDRDYDRNQGRRNQAYNYDDRDRSAPRARSYSSDDGGTDTNVNTSHASIGYGDPNLGTAI